MRITTRKALVPLVAFAMLGAACTSDSDDSATTDGAATTEAGDAGDTGDTGDEPTATDAPDDGDTPDDTVEVVQSDGSTLDAIKEAGVVRCGTRDALPGFAVLTPEGDHVGFDSDFCRVIAAAILGDAEAVEHVDLETSDRFTALQSGEIDVLVRNTTWTASRDGGEGATFLTPNFYDGQGIMVGTDSGFAAITDLDGVIVCVAQGTTTEGNAANEAARLGLDWEVRAFENTELIQEAFIAGQLRRLVVRPQPARRGCAVEFPDGPDALDDPPRRRSRRNHSHRRSPTVTPSWHRPSTGRSWRRFRPRSSASTRRNVDTFADTDDVNIQRFLGLEVEGDDGAAVLDPGLGLPTDFAYQVVSQVGNYGEIFAEHLAPLGLERGVNSLWTDGGLLYAMPYR